jgi:hypothetical protein
MKQGDLIITYRLDLIMILSKEYCFLSRENVLLEYRANLHHNVIHCRTKTQQFSETIEKIIKC